MSRGGLVGLDRNAFKECLAVIDDAVREGSRRALGRIAAREEVSADEALLELAAFPARACAAVEPGTGVNPSLCLAGRGCPVQDECPLVRGGGPESIARSAVAQLVGVLVGKWTRPLPVAPFGRLAALPPLVDELVTRSRRVGPGSGPRARTSQTVLDLALRRGGPFGATGPYLTGAELEQVAAFVPPGSGRDDPRLAPVEAWLRRAVACEAALVELG